MIIQQRDTRASFNKHSTSKIIGLLTLLLSVFVLLSACSPSSQPAQSSQKSQTVMIHASWAEYYPSLKELKQHADVAIRGSVFSFAPAVKSADGLISTTVTITVTQVLWSSQQKSLPATVSLEELGGTYQNVKYMVDDDQAFLAHEQVILFLKETAPGKFRIVGGPTGRFRIVNGVVQPIVSDGVQLSTNESEAQFSSALLSK